MTATPGTAPPETIPQPDIEQDVKVEVDINAPRRSVHRLLEHLIPELTRRLLAKAEVEGVILYEDEHRGKVNVRVIPGEVESVVTASALGWKHTRS